jgi:hypothetical protein
MNLAKATTQPLEISGTQFQSGAKGVFARILPDPESFLLLVVLFEMSRVRTLGE